MKDAASQLGPAGVAGCVLVAFVLALSLIGPFLTGHDPNAVELANRLRPPSGNHWLGTDELGRDLFARIAHGGARTLLAALGVVSCVAVAGVLIGGAAALSGKFVETAVMRAADILLSIPGLVLAMALAAALGPGLVNAMIALGVSRLPLFVRLARNQATVLRRAPYVEFARLSGARPRHVLAHHIAPNAAPPLLVQAVSDVSGAILAVSALGFIGLGSQPPSPEWGALVASGRLYVLDAWWLGVAPGLAIALAAVGFTLVGDALRDAFDPRTQQKRG